MARSRTPIWRRRLVQDDVGVTVKAMSVCSAMLPIDASICFRGLEHQTRAHAKRPGSERLKKRLGELADEMVVKAERVWRRR